DDLGAVAGSKPRIAFEGEEAETLRGLVDLPRALSHWDAAERAGIRPAPLHLLDRVVGLPLRPPGTAGPAPDPAGSPGR
ncbi:hypothetical protein ACWGKK_37440, partial [Streptomyces chartreusis]